jgi:hypothetical protein
MAGDPACSAIVQVGPLLSANGERDGSPLRKFTPPAEQEPSSTRLFLFVAIVPGLAQSPPMVEEAIIES